MIAAHGVPAGERGPGIAVVMIFLDAARFLREALDSVVAQTWRDWELVLVDDGSTDDSPAIAREYVEKHPERIRYVIHPGGANRGLSASRNAGIAATTASLVAFLDADDVWQPDKLAEQHAILAEHPTVDVVFGNTLYWYGWTGDPADAKKDRLWRQPAPSDVAVCAPEYLLACVSSGRWPSPGISSVIVRRDALARVGGFDESLVTWEDNALMLKLLTSGGSYHADRCWDFYRRHGDSFMARLERSGEVATAHVAFLRWARSYLVEHAVAFPAVMRAIDDDLRLHEHPLLGRLSRRYLQNKGRQLRDSLTRRVG